MKAFIVACFLAMVATAVAHPDKEQYTDQYDNMNLDEILENKHLSEPYMKCFMEEIMNCTPAAKEIRSNIKEALENNCAKCSDKHKEMVRKVIVYLIKHNIEYWNRLKAKYDPDNKYSKKYENELKEIQA